MAQYLIDDTTLVSIGTAIREKTGKSDLINPTQMPDEIRSIEAGGDTITEWSFNYQGTGFSSAQSSPFAFNAMNELIDGKSFTINIPNTGGSYLFYNSGNLVDLSKVVVNIDGGGTGMTAFYILGNCYDLKYLPKLNVISSPASVNIKGAFYYCEELEYIDEDYWREWQKLRASGVNDFQLQEMFCGCQHLRRLPDMSLLDDIITSQTSGNRQLYFNLCNSCYVLDTVEYLPVINTTNAITNNMMGGFSDNYRLKDVIFATNEDGTAIARNWSNQYLDLLWNIGYGNKQTIIDRGISADKYVYDDATYQALKNDPDWFSDKIEYSRYNHDSAVRTINSLPDLSSGTGNTIAFKGASGSATDGGAINTLTEEEIAVATAKGWTVSIV